MYRERRYQALNEGGNCRRASRNAQILLESKRWAAMCIYEEVQHATWGAMSVKYSRLWLWDWRLHFWISDLQRRVSQFAEAEHLDLELQSRFVSHTWYCELLNACLGKWLEEERSLSAELSHTWYCNCYPAFGVWARFCFPGSGASICFSLHML